MKIQPNMLLMVSTTDNHLKSSTESSVSSDTTHERRHMIDKIKSKLPWKRSSKTVSSLSPKKRSPSHQDSAKSSHLTSRTKNTQCLLTSVLESRNQKQHIVHEFPMDTDEAQPPPDCVSCLIAIAVIAVYMFLLYLHSKWSLAP